MDVEAELSQLAEEFGFGVKHIGTSRWTKSRGAPGERAYVAVTTLEGTPLCIELSTRGWKVLGELEDAASSEAQFADLRNHEEGSRRCYDTMQALLMTESPLYRQAFHDRLLGRLSAAFPHPVT
ncbi:uncharacterized protein ACA1_374420 [Acanthamoeba castellanii str. Neff]|uniref:GSKIP domain-containing protein n=1 Tax=Acanthamoeba castellanii (strain ATCC 30010 / Neff) TaxID=1257118 RepID=L8GHP0_ACACF|nr:uncharacterized protein ACA1_374420 [Acanthamoeba castellanii str. Neff]ELR12374.1 hypothetical protein ACA1_374420 [Acanthamoeba castellanii str. Neff]